MPTEPRLKILVVSNDTQLLAELSRLDPDRVELLHARRPAESVRRFEAESPDLVIVELSARPEQEALLIHAIHERPLGALVPIFLIDRQELRVQHPLATLDGAREAGADRFFPHGTPSAAILAAAADALNTSPPLAPPAPLPAEPAPPTPAPRSWAAVPTAAPSAPPRPAPAPPPNAPPAPSAALLSAITEPATPEAIRRKLRQARHEDYFTLLDVRKSADRTQIEQAWRALRARFDPERLPRQIADRHYQELAELCDALDDAFGVLGDEALRKDYLAALLRNEQANPGA